MKRVFLTQLHAPACRQAGIQRKIYADSKMRHLRPFVWQRILIGFLIQGFFCLSFAFANSPVKDFKVPEQVGSVKEIFEAQSTSLPERTIIQIQDAHCNYEAQKNLAQILEYLIKEKNLRLIMVEGGSGDVSLSFLRTYADKKTREEVADKYLKMGKISGEEYLDIITDHNIELYGIEDESLYDAHLAAFFKIDSIKEEGLKYLESLYYIIEALKPHIYSPELIDLEAKKKNYEDKALSLVEYCQYLNGMAAKKNLENKHWPQLVTFCEVARLEKEIDFKQAESQRNTFIRDLANLIDEKGVNELINKSQDFKSGKLSPQEYYSFLKTLSEQKLDLDKNYPHLASYIRYITISKDINVADLLKEISLIEERIKEACFTNTQQRRLSEIAKSLDILTSVLNLELTPEDYEYFKVNRSKFATSSWMDFLSQNCQKFNLALYPSASTVIDDNLFRLSEFYQLGIEREEVFIKNLVNKMDESGEKFAVLITGGFHTPGVSGMLKDKGYSYAVVTPVITKKGDSSIYFSVLRSEKKVAEEAFNLEEEEEEEEEVVVEEEE